MNKIKVVFMGTPEFSVPVLESLIKEYDVIGVVTQPDKEVGRKKVLTFSPVKELALKHNIKVLQPVKIRKEFEEVLALKPDIIVTCAYGQIIPKEILDCPRLGCINVHGSLLPKYRGGAPIERSMMNGDKETGITLMYMDEGMDSGDIIKKEAIPIRDDESIIELRKELSLLGKKMLMEELPNIINGKAPRIKQNEEEVTIAKIIKREDELLDFNNESLLLYNKIRALSPDPACYSYLDSKLYKIYNSRIGSSNKSGVVGEIINVYKDGIGIKSLDGELIITDIQVEGKKRMLVSSYLNGINKDSLLGKVFKNEL
jgi:methionyl-tRNA formyltransferase